MLGLFALSLLLNFILIAGYSCYVERSSFLAKTAKVLFPVFASEIAAATMAVGVAFLYHRIGIAAIALFGIVLFTYQYLLGQLRISEQRAEELERRGKQLSTRTRQLATLQVGMLSALLRTLDLRDRMTARHSAAVARYAREIAIAAGFSKEEQDLVHTAGLLHDLGKFIFPDRILKGDTKLTDEDWNIIKMHPYQGARVVAQMEGYGPISEIILAHHERIDGKGYPRGLKGPDIPALSRIISVADTYDVMTARDSYRKPISSFEAIQELKRVAGSQLDAEYVELFIKILAGKDVRFRHGEDADFDAELGLDKRVAEYSLPLELEESHSEEHGPAGERTPQVHAAIEAASRPLADSSCATRSGGTMFTPSPVPELEAGEARQARHHVDVPVKMLGAARGGAHPEVHRGCGAEAVLELQQPLVQKPCAGLRLGEARLVAARHEL